MLPNWLGLLGGTIVGRDILTRLFCSAGGSVPDARCGYPSPFFWQLDACDFQLAGCWLFFGFFRMLGITSSGELCAPNAPGYRNGLFLIVI